VRLAALHARSADARGSIWGMGVIALVSSGCADQPSFTVEWEFAASLEQLGASTTPEDEAECAEIGVDGIRVQTFSTVSGVQLDDRTFECAASPGDGPELEPGEYRVEMSGVRRAGGEWSCVDTDLPIDVCALRSACEGGGQWCTCDAETDCGEGLTCVARPDIVDLCEPGGSDDVTRHCMACSVRAAELITISGSESEPIALQAVMISPPQCDDGIDNDGDGFTDALDPACSREGVVAESDDAGDTVFALGLSFFSNSPVVDCFELALGSLRADLVSDPGGTAEVFESISVPCTRSITPFARTLDEGDYELRLTAVRPNGSGGFDDVTVTQTEAFSVSPVEGAFVGRAFDFDDDDFLDPVMGPIAFFPSYEFVSDAPPRTSCTASASSFSSLEIESLRVSVFDENDDPVDPATIAVPGAVDQGDGSFLMDCPSAGVSSAADLLWNKYAVSVEALVGGETCFTTTSPRLLSPRTGQSLVLDRVLTDGVATGACADCSVNEDCIGSSDLCVDGICVP
jgi:hypothetical protein